MERKIITLKTELENDTYYYADKDRYDVYPNDATTYYDKSLFYDESGDITAITSAFYIKGKKNVTLDFCGATLVLHDKIQPFTIQDCENVTIKNCTVLYTCKFWFEADIIKRDNNTITLKACDGFDYRIENGRFIPYDECGEHDFLDKKLMMIEVFDPKTNMGKSIGNFYPGLFGDEVFVEDNLPGAAKQYRVKDLGEYFTLTGDLHPAWVEGNVLAFSYENRRLCSVIMQCSRDVTIENYRILNGGGMGILLYHCENITLNAYNMYHDEKSIGIVSNNGDAIHAIACAGKFNLENCRLEGMFDDAFNFHGTFFMVKDVCDGVITAESRASLINVHMKTYLPGDNIAVYHDVTLEEINKFLIKETEIVDSRTIKFYVDGDISGINSGDLIENISTQPEITIKNCVFRKSNTHMRFQSRGKILMEDSEIALPVLLTGDTTYWFESSPVTDLTFKNCRFTTPEAFIRILPSFKPTENEPYYHKNIKVLDCSFVSDTPVIGGYADNIEFFGNTADVQMNLMLNDCGKISSDNANVIRDKSNHGGYGTRN